jgi:hypothetical protein
MAPKKSKKDFYSFIRASKGDHRLARGFFSKRSTKALFKFFKKNGFTDIKQPECRNILKLRSLAGGEQIPRHGEDPCPSTRQGY